MIVVAPTTDGAEREIDLGGVMDDLSTSSFRRTNGSGYPRPTAGPGTN
jgi:hypothetical protein